MSEAVVTKENGQVQLAVEKKQGIQEKQQKLLLTMILKDDTEYDDLDRCLNSFMPFFDGLCVAITGISGQNEKLKKLIEHYGGKYVVVTPETNPEIYAKDEAGNWYFASFAAARNVSFKLAEQMQEEGQYDWWSWCDVDDVLLYGEELQAAAKRAQEIKLDSVFFTYWYAIVIRPDGSFGDDTVQIEHLRERLLRPGKGLWKWVSRLHEIAIPADDAYRTTNSLYDYAPNEDRHCVWAHLTTRDRIDHAAKRNIQILEEQRRDEMAKGKDDPRTVFYLAKSYFDVADKDGDNRKVNYDLADMLLDEYLENSGWAEERASAWEYKARIMMARGNHQGAIHALHEALKQYGNRHMQFLLLSREYAQVQDFEQSDFWLDVAMHLESPKARTTIGTPLEIKVLAASLMYNKAMRKMDLKDAKKWFETRNRLVQAEGDDDVLHTLSYLTRLNDACMWVFNYAKWLKDNGHRNLIPKLLEAMPLDLGREVFAHQIANEVVEPKVWGEKEIVYYASWGAEHFEGWSPKNMKSGIGGSETAVIQLAKEWVKLGYHVTVYGDPRDDAGEYEGVTYKPYYAINWNDTFNILILWRSPHLLDKDIKAKKIFMDLHDVASQLDWNEKRMEKIDKVFFKSKFHRSMIPKLPDSKAVVISNGV